MHAHNLLEKIILAWDPDYTKLTPQEIAELENEAGHIKQELTLEQEVRKMFGDVPIEIL